MYEALDIVTSSSTLQNFKVASQYQLWQECVIMYNNHDTQKELNHPK